MFERLVSTIRIVLFAATAALMGKIGVSTLSIDNATLLHVTEAALVAYGVIAVHRFWLPPDRRPAATSAALMLSSLAAAFSWLCYYHVAEIDPNLRTPQSDQLSAAMALLGSAMFLGEAFTWKAIFSLPLVLVDRLMKLLRRT